MQIVGFPMRWLISLFQVACHRLLSHESIIKFYGFRKDGKIQYIFLEYASGGELFDRIGIENDA